MKELAQRVLRAMPINEPILVRDICHRISEPHVRTVSNAMSQLEKAGRVERGEMSRANSRYWIRIPHADDHRPENATSIPKRLVHVTPSKRNANEPVSYAVSVSAAPWELEHAA